MKSQRPSPQATLDISPTWARDACRCSECRDPISGQHLLDATDLAGWSVKHGERTSDDGLIVLLRHDDGSEHRAIIPPSSRAIDGVTRTLWGAEHGDHLQKQMSTSTESLESFVVDLAEFGIALIDNVDPTPGAVLAFTERIGFVRTTNYGDLFDVRTTQNASNLAFTSKGLPLHTDNPYRDPVPTVQLLHCLQGASTGGASLFCDGFAAAEQLRETDRECFETLTRTPVTFRFESADTDLVATTPLIDLDSSGSVRRVTVNNRSMEPGHDHANAEMFYSAYQRFCDVLASPERAIEVTLQSGHLVAFDNRRVLHGRSSYTQDPSRHLQGCYADMDAVASTARRILR